MQRGSASTAVMNVSPSPDPVNGSAAPVALVGWFLVDLPVMLRDALELQLLEDDPERAAGTVGKGVAEHGASPVAAVLLEATALAFRRMVAVTDEALDLPELLARLALDGAVPEHRLELLTDVLTASAATAGGIRPSVDALITRLGEQDILFGAWLGLLTGLRVVSLTIEATEAEVVEDLLLAFEIDE